MKGLEAAPAHVWGPCGHDPQPQPDALLPVMPFLERRPTPAAMRPATGLQAVS